MKMLKLCVCLFLLSPTLIFAADTVRKKRRPAQPRQELFDTPAKRPATRPARTAPPARDPEPPPESAVAEASSQVEAPVPNRSRTHSSSIGIGMNTWHETVELKRSGTTAKMYSQLKSVNFGYDFNQLRAMSRWHWNYGIDLGVGTLKGKGNAPITDQFNDQPFIMATARWGMVFRSSSAARAGFFIPLSYRQIQWAYESTSSTKANEAQISIGVGGLFQLRFTPRTSFQASVAHQHMWNANVWAAGLNFEL